jgi:hypothetical protein
MPKIVLKISLDQELHAKIVSAAKGKYITPAAWVVCAAVDALPKQVTVKLSVAEQKAEANQARKLARQADFRRELAEGRTVQEILAGRSSWREQAAQWLGEITRVLPADMPLAGASEAEQEAILAARKAELLESFKDSGDES